MKIGIVCDTLQKSKGHHGTHFAFTGLPDTEIILADPNPAPEEFGPTGAVRHYENEVAYEIIPADAPPEIPGAKPLDFKFGGNPDFRRYFTTANRCAAWDMTQAIREHRRPRSDIRDATAVLEMIYGIYAAHLSGTRIGFPLTGRKHPLAQYDERKRNI